MPPKIFVGRTQQVERLTCSLALFLSLPCPPSLPVKYVVCPPKHLQDRARRYYEYLWGVHRGIDEKSILEDLPSTLHAEVSNVLKLSFIECSPFFELCNPALRKALALSLKSEIFSPGDVVIREGEYGRRMYCESCVGLAGFSLSPLCLLVLLLIS